MEPRSPEFPSSPSMAPYAPAPAVFAGQAYYACWSGCDERYPLTEVRYRCQRCGGLLDVRHDLEALRHLAGQAGGSSR